MEFLEGVGEEVQSGVAQMEGPRGVREHGEDVHHILLSVSDQVGGDDLNFLRLQEDNPGMNEN